MEHFSLIARILIRRSNSASSVVVNFSFSPIFLIYLLEKTDASEIVFDILPKAVYMYLW